MDLNINMKKLILLITVISLLSISILLYPHNTGQIAIIEQNGIEIKRIDLYAVAEPYFFDIDSKYPSKILVEHGQISFYKSTCPDKICEHYGKLSKEGQIAICLPANLIIRIAQDTKSIDGFTG